MTTTRFDLFAAPHKGIRSCLTTTLVRIGALDLDDPVAAEGALGQLDELRTLLAHHRSLEDRFILPALAQRRPGATAACARDHGEDEHALAALGDTARALAAALRAGDPGRAGLARALYLELADLVAFELRHMRHEEVELNPLLWDAFSDAELHAIQGALVGSETPAQLAMGVRWLLPAISPVERMVLVGGARMAIAPPVFDQLLGLARTVLPASDWARLHGALA